MKLCEELYFEITVEGTREALRRFVSYLTSGELDDFFEVSKNYICYGDDFYEENGDPNSSLVFTNDDLGIEIDSFDPEEFLDALCRVTADLDVTGHLYDIDDEEYSFQSLRGDVGYTNLRSIDRFNDESDEDYEERRMGEISEDNEDEY